jgi:hypothetical protein
MKAILHNLIHEKSVWLLSGRNGPVFRLSWDVFDRLFSGQKRSRLVLSRKVQRLVLRKNRLFDPIVIRKQPRVEAVFYCASVGIYMLTCDGSPVAWNDVHGAT